LVSATKDPTKVRAGTIGARTRWGPEPRVVRLDTLTPPQRRLVLALVDAARKEASPTVSETSDGEAQEARRVRDEPSAA
jgi:hypothetical protein